MSAFTGGRNANAGTCNHTCRWNFREFEAAREKTVASSKCQNCRAKIPRNLADLEQQKSFAERQRVGTGEFMKIEEDWHGSHIMSSRDMCMIDILPQVIDSGVTSLKVEGRNKTAYYAATIARAYRQALDDIRAGKEFDKALYREVRSTANRGFFRGFAGGRPQNGEDIQSEHNRSTGEREFAGRVICWEKGRMQIEVKNKISEGEELEIVMPKIKDDSKIIAKNLRFGDSRVVSLHGGNTNQIASIASKKKIPSGVFLRQKV